MSEASRAHALAHAAMVHQGSGDAAATLETAEAFHAFVTSDAATSAPPAKAPAKAAPAKTPAKAPAKAPVKAPAEDPEEAPEEGGEEGDVTKEQVGEAVEALLNANMREQVLALFKKYKAKSLSSIKPEDYAAIKQEADDLLLAS